MCDKKIQFQIPKITSKVREIFKNDHVNIPYTGPTIPEETALMPTPLAQTRIEEPFFEHVSEFVCDRGNFLEAKGKLGIKSISSGPYETFGGTLEFKRLHFHFKNLEIPVRIRYYFNKSKICEVEVKEEEPDISENQIVKDMSGRNFGSIISNVRTDGSGISFEKYFCSDGEDPSNINQLFYDLEPYFSDYSSNFGVFFDVLLDPILDQSMFAKKIHHQMIKLYCKETPKSSAYQDKIQRIKNMGWANVILLYK